MPTIPLIGPSYTMRSVNLDSQRTVNLMAVMDETQQGTSIGMLLGTPGLSLFTTLPGSGGVRPNGLYTTSQGRCFVVQGSGLYEVYATGTTVLLGNLLTLTGPVCMKDNGIHLMIVDGAYGYALTIATGMFQQLTSEAFYGADRVDFLDTYLILNRPGTNQFYFTDLLSVDFDALDFYSLIGSPDTINSLLITHREIWLYGQKSTEVWIDTQDGTNPFARIQGVLLEVGCCAAQTPVKFAQSQYWLGTSERGGRQVYEAQGYQAKVVSTEPLEYALKQYPTVSDAYAFGEEDEHHAFYWLTCPSGNATWVYDLSTGLWHERAYRDPLTGALGRHRASAHTYAFDRHLVGDYATGRLYVLSLETFTDNGDPIQRVRRAPCLFSNDLPWMLHGWLQLDVESGVGVQGTDPGTGTALAPGIDPQLLLRYSDDGAHTWSTERVASLGKVGATRQRAVWRRLGRSRQRVYEVSSAAPVKQVWLAAYLKAEKAVA